MDEIGHLLEYSKNTGQVGTIFDFTRRMSVTKDVVQAPLFIATVSKFEFEFFHV